MTDPIDFSALIAHWRDIEGEDNNHYRGSDELQSISASYGEKFGLMRLGIHHERLKPGRRVSWPHAEADEEEFVFVLEGEPDLWVDGYLKRLKPGDGVSFVPCRHRHRAYDPEQYRQGCDIPGGGRSVPPEEPHSLPTSSASQRRNRRPALENRTPAALGTT